MVVPCHWFCLRFSWIGSQDAARERRMSSLGTSGESWSTFIPILTYGHELHLRWLGHLIRMPLGHLPLEIFHPTGRRPQGRTRTCWRITYLILLGNAPGEAEKRCWGEGSLYYLALTAATVARAPDKRHKIDGWMERDSLINIVHWYTEINMTVFSFHISLPSC